MDNLTKEEYDYIVEKVNEAEQGEWHDEEVVNKIFETIGLPNLGD